MVGDEQSNRRVTPQAIHWQRITDRHEATLLETFSCTIDRPRTPQGRKLPHPKPWEREVQSHFRQCSKRLRAGDLLMVGRHTADEQIVAAAHLMLDQKSPSPFTAHIAAIGICTTVCGQGGKVADSTLVEVCSTVVDRARGSGIDIAVATANIHVRNLSSQSLFERNGFEPVSVPSGDYQQWICRLL